MTTQTLTDAEAARFGPDPDDAGLGALSTERGNLPLYQLEVRTAVTGLVARTEVTQGFRNPYDVPLEASYIFPLPDRAAVTAMRMEADDRVVEGRLEEREQARQSYDAAIASGRRASIAEQERPDVFTMRVGNILPGERVTARLTLDGPLPYEDGAATFRFPLVVAPRYIPGRPIDGGQAGDGTAPDTDLVPDASRITPPVLLPGFPNPVALAVTVDIDPAGLPLVDVASSLHEVRREDTDGRTRITLVPGERLDRDLVLRLGYRSGDAAAGALVLAPDAAPEPEPAESEGTFRLTVLPPPARDGAPGRDVVLVLDRSGSMGGWKMVAARRAAARIVDTLTDRDRFSVLLFDTVVERPEELPAGLVDGTDRNRFRAVRALSGTEARGGTELSAPLAEAAGLLTDPDRDRVLVLVTDGQVGNEDELVRLVADRLPGARVHTVGIDRAVNAGFLGRLASVGGGRCELVESEDRLDDAMDRIHRRIGAPSVTGLRLETSGLTVVDGTVTPARLPDLHEGVPLVLSGRYRGAGEGAAVTLRGRTADDGPWSTTLRPSEGRASGPVAAIWARAHLADLEDRYAAGGDRSELSGLERRMVQTSLRFGVLCRFTAFVATDTRVVTDGGTPHRVTQPVEQPSGWESRFPAPAPGGIAPVAYGAAVWLGQAEQAEYEVDGAAPMSPGSAPRHAPRRAPAPPAPTPPPAPSGPPMPGAPSAAPAPRPGAVRWPQAEFDDLDVPDFLKNGSGGSAPPPRPGSRPGDVRRGFAPLPAGGPGAPGEARRTAGAEAARLREAPPESVARRRLRLADLGSRLAALLAHLAVAAPGEPVGELPALVADLERCDGPEPPAGAELDELWERAVRVLTAFAGGGSGTDAGGAPGGGGSPRAFWKRS